MGVSDRTFSFPFEAGRPRHNCGRLSTASCQCALGLRTLLALSPLGCTPSARAVGAPTRAHGRSASKQHTAMLACFAALHFHTGLSLPLSSTLADRCVVVNVHRRGQSAWVASTPLGPSEVLAVRGRRRAHICPRNIAGRPAHGHPLWGVGGASARAHYALLLRSARAVRAPPSGGLGCASRTRCPTSGPAWRRRASGMITLGGPLGPCADVLALGAFPYLLCSPLKIEQPCKGILYPAAK